MQIYQYSGIGQRKVNQDSLIAHMINDDEGIFIVADGMGGYTNGKEAATLVAEAVKGFISTHTSAIQPSELLHQAVIEANNQLSLRRYAYGGAKMGAVIAIVYTKNDIAYCTWLGDSRIYHIRSGQIVFVSHDHSALNELGLNKVLSPSQIKRYANVVTRCIMGEEKLDPMEVSVLQLKQGDRIIICSDGLHKNVNIEILPVEDNKLDSYLKDNIDMFDDNYSIIKLMI